MKRLQFSPRGMVWFWDNEGAGWQFHWHCWPWPKWFEFIWGTYGIDKIDSCRYYATRRLCIVRFLWFQLWLDLGRVKVVRYVEPYPSYARLYNDYGYKYHEEEAKLWG